MAIATPSGTRAPRRPQEGGTSSLSGASRTDAPTASPSLPILYQVPLDAAPGVMYMTEAGEVISATEAHQLLATSAVRLVQGAPTAVQNQLVNGKFPAALIPGIEDNKVKQFLASPGVTFDETTDEDGDGGASPTSTAAAQSTEETFQPIAPPVLDILQQLSDRRQRVREAALANFGAIQGAAPQMVNPDVRFFPGLEPGGLGSIALGQSSGLGTEAAESLIPTATREFFRVPLPGLASPQEPTLQSEFGGSLGLAKQILDAIRLFQTGTAQSTQSSTGGDNGTSPDLALAASLASQIIGAPIV